MWTAIYHLIIIGVALWAVLSGYRRGFFRQIGKALAVVVGIVVARIVGPDFIPAVDDCMPFFISGFNKPYVVATIAYGLIFSLVFSLIALICFPLGKMMKMVGGDVVNAICGALFKLFQWLVFLSLLYNLIADLNPAGDMTRSARHHDGNLIECVIKIAPAIMGFPDAEEVGYKQQLEDAKKIS